MSSDALYGEVLDLYAEYVNPNLGRLMAFAGFGVEMQGDGCYIVDHEGRRFLDFLGGYGVFSLGHRHPAIVQAVKDQLDQMPLSGKAFFNRVTGLLAKKLAEISPGDLQLTFFSNSGAEAVEAALKMAKGATGRARIISTHGGYHGKTIGALSTTGRENYRKPFEPLMPGVAFVDYGDLGQMQAAVDGDTACVIIEPLQGEGGINVPPPGYLRGVQEACRAHGALLIADEVQTGFGRTGRMFGCNEEGVEPDIMTMAKCLSGGVMPIGATIMTRAVYDAVFGTNPLSHTSTFGGNPLACAAALASIKVLEDENLIQRSFDMGLRLRAGLENVRSAHLKMIAEVRGKGLMVGVEFAEDEVGELVVAQMLKRDMCAAYTLNNPRVMRFEPPLTISESEIDLGVSIFGEAVAETSELLEMLV